MNCTALLSLQRTGPQADANRLRLRAAMFRPYDPRTAQNLVRAAEQLEAQARCYGTNHSSASQRARSRTTGRRARR
jgi:hypothetical protein